MSGPCVDFGEHERGCTKCGKRFNADLKAVLMEVGNGLVMDYGFGPAIGDRQHGAYSHNTEAIRCFTEWVNANPEARELLESYGLTWSM